MRSSTPPSTRIFRCSIVGETGTGKELFARALHEMGRRARFPYVAVNCGAIPEALFEAEFFGHARGSFTGAERARRGLLAASERGTLLLDEVGELPAMRQASLLRALESKKYRAVGSDDEQSFDVRIVAATHRDLAKAADEGTFRRDLLFRLNVVEIRVPPLRDREGDIEMLAAALSSRGRLDREAHTERHRSFARARLAGQRAGARAPHAAPGRAFGRRDRTRNAPARNPLGIAPNQPCDRPESEPITSAEKSNVLSPRAGETSATPPSVSASRDMVSRREW